MHTWTSALVLLLILVELHCCLSFMQRRSLTIGIRKQNLKVLDFKSNGSRAGQGDIVQFLNGQGFTYGTGAVGLIAILVNRLSVLDESVSDFQSRLDLISVMACSALLLNALTTQEIETKERDNVTLVGYSCINPVINPSIESTIVGDTSWWLCNIIMKGVQGVTSVHIIQKDQILARCGVVGAGDDRNEGIIRKGKILTKALEEREEQYLPDVQILPGKVSDETVDFLSRTFLRPRSRLPLRRGVFSTKTYDPLFNSHY